MVMSKNRRARNSLSMRLQPYEGTPLYEVADYLNSLDKEEATRRIGEILVMAFLPYARNNGDKSTSSQLSSAFLIARDMADKHFGVMALALGLDAGYVVTTIANGNGHKMVVEDKDEDKPLDNNSSLICGQVTAAEISQLF